jgi:hypothetical protein
MTSGSCEYFIEGWARKRASTKFEYSVDVGRSMTSTKWRAASWITGPDSNLTPPTESSFLARIENLGSGKSDVLNRGGTRFARTRLGLPVLFNCFCPSGIFCILKICVEFNFKLCNFSERYLPELQNLKNNVALR